MTNTVANSAKKLKILVNELRKISEMRKLKISVRENKVMKCNNPEEYYYYY